MRKRKRVKMKRIKVTRTIIKEYRKRTAKKICPVVMKYGFGKIEVKRTPVAITTTEYINASYQHPDEIIFNSENEFLNLISTMSMGGSEYSTFLKNQE